MLFFPCISHIYRYICTRKERSIKLRNISEIETKGLVAQLNSASDYGSEGYWFESSRGHYSQKAPIEEIGAFLFSIFNWKVIDRLLKKSFSFFLKPLK